MVTLYTTADGFAYGAADGTPIMFAPITDLITNRSAVDVAAVKALEVAIKAGTATEEQVHQYLNVHQKGAYTYEDLNRVELATGYVAERLRKFGYPQALFTRWNWSVDEKPSTIDFDRYFGNVATLRNVVTVWASTPVAPMGIEGFDIHKANALEQILIDVDDILTRISQAWFYSDDLYSAEV